jgi:hypothetical protein
MAKFKVHKLRLLLDPLAPMMDNGERGGHAEQTALCRTTHRSLLPLLLDDDWSRVTCERCLKRRPKAPTWWERLLAFVGINRRAQ